MEKVSHAADEAANDAQASATSLYARLKRLEKPRALQAAVALSFVLMLPGVLSGLSLDDYVLLDELSRPESTLYSGHAPFDLFRWTQPESVSRLIDGGGVSWWVSPQTRIAFMRPLSSLSHALDHWLWPSSPLAMHLHNLFWFGLLLSFTFQVYRQLLVRSWTLGLACMMFALDSAHAGPVGWIANRNGLMSAAFAVACLVCHHRARSARPASGGWRWGILGALAFVASLLASELGVGIFGYLFAYAVLYETGSLRGRLASLTPYVLTVGGLVAARGRLGYGVLDGFGNYADPLQEPLRFAHFVPVRATLLLASQFTRFCSDVYEVSLPPMQPYVLAVAVVLLASSLWFIAPAIKADRTSRFFFAGAVLAAIPPVGATASERLLLLVGLGVPPVLAEAVRRALVSPARVRFGRPAGARGARRTWNLPLAQAGVILVAHLALDPLLMPLYAAIPGVLGREAQRVSDQLPLAAGAQRTVFVASIPDTTPLYYAQVMRRVRGQPSPQRLYWLAGASEGTRYVRRGPRELRVINPAGFWDARWEERSPELPLHVGDHIELTELRVHVVEVTPDGRPSVVDFTFSEPLESERYAWLDWRDGKLQPFTPPMASSSERHTLFSERGSEIGARSAR